MSQRPGYHSWETPQEYFHFSNIEYAELKLVAHGFPTLTLFAAFLHGKTKVFPTPFWFNPGRNWSQRPGLNRRPPLYESGALPTELRWRNAPSLAN